ncbi:unnamed protein product, partial [Amoebophrya sp. A25]
PNLTLEVESLQQTAIEGSKLPMRLFNHLFWMLLGCFALTVALEIWNIGVFVFRVAMLKKGES